MTTSTDVIDLKAVSTPSTPAKGHIKLYIDSADGRIKIRRSNGDVVVIE